MKLFYSPSSCSLSPHIVLRELDLPFTLDRVDPATKRTESGSDYLTINPKGYVPALELDDGEVLTEGPAITQYLVDRYAPGTLAPLSGTIERARVNSYLTYIGTELHKPFGRLFDPALTPDSRASTVAYLNRRFALIEQELADGQAFLTGSAFTLPDAYLVVIQRWGAFTGFDLSPFPNIVAHAERVMARPAVRLALDAEK
ncbi:MULTISPECIES: glutathione transferase GstA [unclassified Bradyrhizobium]|uniref:glutathione transferase GstA n=1 Tax=unclassified Bradyrhizobium TaxID=2631580 RepID=UPI003394B58D